MTRKERFRFVIDYFQQHNPSAETELIYDNPYQLLVAVILSAQCTDKRVNMTTPAIFDDYPDAHALAKAEYEGLFQLIKFIPPQLVHKFHHWLILHGRYVCVARTPKCGICGLKPVCKYYHKFIQPEGLSEAIG